ncbi:hypothetical protein D5086_003198 [Populus alba]|uniref:Uncharacterized protein n=1 Tax=Populus alba TaxID=43335 RepID=A0ACC4D431_POPAL
MAVVNSITAALTSIPSLTISTPLSFPCKTTKLSSFSLNNNAFKTNTTLIPSLSTSRVFAAPEALDSQTTLDPLPDTLDAPYSDTFQVEGSETPSSQSVSIAADADKDARFHFEIRTHQRLIDIMYPTAQTIDSLMQLDIPAGVDVEVKL